MKTFPQVLAGAVLLMSVATVRGQTPDTPDHSAPNHTHEAKATSEESNVDYFWRKSDEAFHAGDYPRAIALHRAIIALAPDDTQSYGVAAWLLWSSDQKDAARALIERGLKANPLSLAMWTEAGEQFDLQKLPAEALDAYRHAVALIPPSSPKEDFQMLRRQLAHAAQHAGDGALSVQTWRDLVRDFPNETVNTHNLQLAQAKFSAQ